MSAPNLDYKQQQTAEELDHENLDRILLSDFQVTINEPRKESKGSSGSFDKNKRSCSVPSLAATP